MVFSWHRWNIEHIARHDVTPEEAEHLVRNATAPFPRAIGDGKFLVWGRTDSGRLLQVVFTKLPDSEVDIGTLSPSDRFEFQSGATVIFVIHAMELTPDQKRQYRRL